MNHPDYPKGTGFDVGGLLVPNGGSVEVDEDHERALVSQHGASVKDALSNNPHLKISGTTTLSAKELDALAPEPEGGEG